MEFNYNRFQDIKEQIEDLSFEKKTLQSKLSGLEYDKVEVEKDLIASRKAQSIILSEAALTQGEIEDHISSVVTMALSAVEVDDPRIPKPPEFVVKAVERRGNTEFDLLFRENSCEQDPLDSSGHGYCNVADYALKIVYKLLEIEYIDNSIRRVLILDEPFRDADPQLQYKISEMLNMVSHELSFQQIIVSHAEGVNINADRVFLAEKKGKTSKVFIEE